MTIAVLGAGMVGRAIALDLAKIIPSLLLILTQQILKG